MRNWPEGVLWKLIAFGMLLATGCASGSGLIGVPHSGGISAPPPLPPTDAGLADHVPGRVVIRFQPESDPRTILGSIGGRVLRELKGFNAVVAEVPNGSSVVDTIRRLQAIPDVKYAEPEYVYRALQAPNDPYFATKQWGPQKIGAVSAWTITTGANTLIAVLDTNVGNNFDFGPRFRGFHSCVASGGATDHGTHVAGTAAALGNNSTGVVGVAFNPATQILPVKVLDNAGFGTDAGVAAGIIQAADAINSMGKKGVINLSLGGAGYPQVQQDAVEYATSLSGGSILVVVAMGNSFKRYATLFPAALTGVMAVGATNGNDTKEDFSDPGPHISVAAPGRDVYSTSPAASYAYMSGTSMASPHAAGLAALVWSQNPTFTNYQVRRAIEVSAADLGPAGWDESFGWGRINAAGAVTAMPAAFYGCAVVTVQTSPPPTVQPGADVIVGSGSSQRTSLTNSAGVVRFDFIPAGSYTVTASKVITGTGHFGSTSVAVFATGPTICAIATITIAP